MRAINLIHTANGKGNPGLDSRKVLWASVSALMKKHYGKENLTQLARDCKFGPGTASRLKEGKTSVGLELIDKIAGHFGVEPWELLVPNFDPANRPTFQPLSEAERKLYLRWKDLVQETIEQASP